MKKYLVCILCTLVIGVSIVPVSAAEDLTIAFDPMARLYCGDEWEQGGLSFKILPLSTNCATSQTWFGWGLHNACLEIDVRPLLGLSKVTVTFTNYSDPGSVYVFLLDATVPLRMSYCVESRILEQIVIPADDLAVERVRVFSTSAYFNSVSFQYEVVSSKVSSWGSVKAMFR